MRPLISRNTTRRTGGLPCAFLIMILKSIDQIAEKESAIHSNVYAVVERLQTSGSLLRCGISSGHRRGFCCNSSYNQLGPREKYLHLLWCIERNEAVVRRRRQHANTASMFFPFLSSLYGNVAVGFMDLWMLRKKAQNFECCNLAGLA